MAIIIKEVGAKLL